MLLPFLLQAIFGIQYTLAECPESLEGLTKWSDLTTAVSPSGAIEITEPILLDTETERLSSVWIGNGGRLVFDPTAPLAKLTAGRITIDDEGYLDIGSADCPFAGNAEILLTGTRNDDQDDDETFGAKFLGVKAGGSLEIHGPYKRSWTKLERTLNPKEAAYIYDDTTALDTMRGIQLFEFDRNTGTLIQKIGNIRRMNKWLERKLDTISADSVVVIVKSDNLSGDIYEKSNEFVELLQSKLTVDGITLGATWTDPLDTWGIVIDQSTGLVTEVVGNVQGEKSKAEGDVNINGYIYKWMVTCSENWSGNREYIRVIPNSEENPYDEFEVTLVDDVSTWNAGDKLVIASTDFDMNQAEEVEVLSVDGNRLTFKGDIKYMHFGEVYEGVDMRAEVGLLTRNILIRGEMGDECQPEDESGDELNECQDFDFDNFGGHTRAINGFKAYNIVGAEVTNMGQMTILGSYPIHIHMALDTARGAVIEQNSIHHCFSRCVTIHGSHGVLIQDNVGYDTFGHCFFTEDGGEKDTTFNGNLGLSTRKGVVTPSDVEPSTFWITSPLTTFTNNAAAGSDNSHGSGIWYLFPDEPVGPSAGLGLFRHREAKMTPILPFENNSAHSNGKIGLRFDKRLNEIHGIIGCSTYDPRIDPTNRRSNRTAITLNGFTGYKNRKYNAKMRSTTAELKNFMLADAPENMAFERNMLDGYQRISDSVIIGESPNKGSGHKIKILNENNKWEWIWSDRSRARMSEPFTTTGIYINAEGPTHIHDVTFKDFGGDSVAMEYCGIKFKDDFHMGMGASSSVKGLDFGDMADGSRICHKNEKFGNDEPSMVLRDLDGTLSGTPGVSVAADVPYYHEGMECETNAEWNMAVCNGNFARFYLWPKPVEAGDIFVTREGDSGDLQDFTRLVGFTVSPLSRYHVHFVKYPTNADGWFKPTRIRFTGMDGGMTFRLGICVPMAITREDISVSSWLAMEGKRSSWRDVKNGVENDAISEAATLEELDSDDTKNVFFDRVKGMVYVKAIENDVRGVDDLADCVGSLTIDNSCPAMEIRFNMVQKMFPDLVIEDNADCTTR